MVYLTIKGEKRLEDLKDYFPPPYQYSSIKMRTKYILDSVTKNPKFYIEPSSILRPDWNRCINQDLMIYKEDE